MVLPVECSLLYREYPLASFYRQAEVWAQPRRNLIEDRCVQDGEFLAPLCLGQPGEIGKETDEFWLDRREGVQGKKLSLCVLKISFLSH